MDRDFIAIIDFGSQYAHLIAKRIRHLGIYTRIFPPLTPVSDLAPARGIILSGGPQSVFGRQAVPVNPDILQLDRPLLGLCYGHQLMAHTLGGTVENLGRGEYGKTRLTFQEGGGSLLAGIAAEQTVWMSHGDTVQTPPPGFRAVAHTALCPVAAMVHESQPRYGLQFHPEVTDTPAGSRILANFVAITGARQSWSMSAYIRDAVAACKAQVGDRSVLMFLSGGVDSTVAFALLTEALGTQRVRGLLIDTGFLRKDEARTIMARYGELGYANVALLDASAEFLGAVAGLVDPQEKRQAIGETFLAVRNSYLESLHLDPEQWMLGQGTLYPDIIESGGTAHADVIKSHHNRVDAVTVLIEAGHVVEPLHELYKDEVRELGLELGLPADIVWRHPFPGPGLAINVLCASGEETYPEQAEHQARVNELLADSPFSGTLLPVCSVGVQGDNRTYTSPVALSGPQDWDTLEETAILLTNSIRGINRVVTLLRPTAMPALRPHPAQCTAERLGLLREADSLATDALGRAGLMRDIFQLLVILLPLGTGNEGECIVLRPVVSEDVMTAQFAKIPWDVVIPLADALLALPGVEAVFHDVTHKPPATFGWE